MFVEKAVETMSPADKAGFDALTAVAVARRQAAENAPAYQAKGKALAELAINEARGQGAAWTRIYRAMLELEAEGRKAFRSEIATHQKAMQAHVTAHKEGDTENPVYATAKRSGMVRLSELTTITKAIDVGVEFDKEWPFHYAVGHARTALRSQGKADTRGRKPTPVLDKIKAYLEKNVPEGEWESVRDLVTTMAALHE